MPDTRRRTDAVRNAALALAVVGLVALLLVIAAGVNALGGLAEQGAAQAEQATAQRELLIACTVAPEERTPPNTKPDPSDCYISQQLRTAKLLGEPPAPINPTVIAASACANKYPGDFQATNACVVDLLRREKILQDAEAGP